MYLCLQCVSTSTTDMLWSLGLNCAMPQLNTTIIFTVIDSFCLWRPFTFSHSWVLLKSFLPVYVVDCPAMSLIQSAYKRDASAPDTKQGLHRPPSAAQGVHWGSNIKSAACQSASKLCYAKHQRLVNVWLWPCAWMYTLYKENGTWLFCSIYHAKST